MTNPLLTEWSGPFALPPFAQIEDSQFEPALEQGMEEGRASIAAIADEEAAPTFANTIEALERAGGLLNRVASVFYNLAGADSTPAREELMRDMAPRMSAYGSEITNNEKLFARIERVWNDRETLDLTDEQSRVLMLTHRGFVRSGAGMNGFAADRLTEIKARLATLGTAFGQNLLADEREWFMDLTEDDLDGLPDFVQAAARAAGTERDRPGPAVTLNRSLIVPFLQFSPRRDLREKAYEAWTARGANGGATDNRALAAEILQLRQERAELLGYDSFADYKLETEMAKTPEAVRDLLMKVWEPAQAAAMADAEHLERMARTDGITGPLEPWDWRFYAEKRRLELHDLDEAELKPFFQLDRMIEAAMSCANRLFGLDFAPIDGPFYHADVRGWEVTRDGTHVAVFLGDYFARPSKRSGAWCSAMRSQSKLDGDVRPIVLNVCNFTHADPALLSYDDARTLFHEFGHALHQMLSDVTYRVRLRHLGGARLRGVAQPALRALARRAAGSLRIRHPRGDRRAHPRRRPRPAARRLDLRHGVLHRRIRRLRPRGPGVPRQPRRPPTRCSGRRRSSTTSACPAPSGCATPRRTSPISSRATATRPATTATCGPR